MIHNKKAHEAADINNDGTERQIEWLLEQGFTFDEIEGEIV